MCDQLNRTAKNRCLNCGQAKRFREENIWEGINLKKISKKIVSLVTLAAFALTLVPAAAFAASGDPALDVSVLKTVEKNVEVENGASVQLTFDLLDSAYQDATNNADNVIVWAEDAEGNRTSAAAFYQDNSGTQGTELTPSQAQTYSFSTPTVANDSKLWVSFARPGVYTLHAAQLDKADAVDAKIKSVFGGSAEGYQTITVAAGDVQSIKVDGAGSAVTNGQDGVVSGNIFANNTQTKEISVVAYTDEAATDGKVAAGKTFTIGTNNSNLTVTPVNAQKDGTVVTDNSGAFKLHVTAAKAGQYFINLNSEDGFAARLVVTATDNSTEYPATITADNTDVTMNLADATSFENVVQFSVADQNGDAMKAADVITAEGNYAASATDTDREDYVKLVSKPDKFKGEGKDFQLVKKTLKNGDDVLTLEYKGSDSLVAGEYTVRVALYKTGDYADATIKLGKFDANNVTDLKVVPETDTVTYDATTVTYDVYAVDKNGVESNITDGTNYVIGVDAPSVLGTPVTSKKGEVTFPNTILEKDKADVVGNKIVLTVYSDIYNKMNTAKVTIVDKDVAEGLAFDVDKGPANENNTVKVSVVDADGNIVKVDGKVKAYVASSSNETVNYDVKAGNEVVNGKNGSIEVFADGETTLDIVVAVVDSTNKKIYADTLTYTVGKEDVNADTSIVMTIGSTDYIVNNEIVTGDAAPYVDGNWRTMVPVRALAETFGAEVTFEDNVITIVDGDKTIVMTVGEEAYTVNDEEKTMDTVPVIGEGDRTFVPTRFVAEALGYTVTPLQDANGLTASVVFQK